MSALSDDRKEAIGFGDKAGFIVSFFAAAFPLFAFKDTLDSFRIDILITQCSATSLLLVFLGLLFFSAYFYALSFTKYDWQWLLERPWMETLDFLAKTLYFFAIVVYPGLLILATIVAYIIKPLLADSAIIKQGIFFGITATFSFSAIYLQYRLFQKKKQDLIEELKEREKQLSFRATQYRRTGDGSLVIINLYESLIKIIQAKLVELYGESAYRMPNFEIFRLAKKHNLLTSFDYEMVEELRRLRNRAAHGEFDHPVSDERLDRYLFDVRRIIDRIEKRSVKSEN